LRIALVCNAYPPEFVGGTELVVAAQAKELQYAGHEVRVICGTHAGRAGDLPSTEFVDGVEVMRIDLTADERSSAHWQRERVVRVIGEAVTGSDVVHVHHWSRTSGNLVQVLARDHPVVLTLHDYFASCPRFFRAPAPGITCPSTRPTENCVRCVSPQVGEQAPGVLQPLLTDRWTSFRAELLAAHSVIAPSRSLAIAMADQMEVDGSQWRVIPHGVCRVLTAMPRNSAPAGEPLTVLSFGNRSELKGTLDLVRAAAGTEPGTVRLILAGCEVQAGFDAELRAAAGELELELIGRYDSEELALLAARSDLAAFPSRALESYGLVLEEALALGLPTWVSDRGALPEVLAGTVGSGPLPGGVLPAECPAAWTQLFHELANSPRKLQDAARCVPKQNKLAGRAIQQQLEIYNTILGRTLPGRL
jgi:glycosyltransferase involved in cell wall biosynthesis